jgi:dihydrodipicolinate synthase/N-acetylneuraminate lyase
VSKQFYEAKFQSFIEMCAQAKEKGVDAVVIHHPEALGDNYSELVESLNRLSAAELKLVIVPPDQRGA